MNFFQVLVNFDLLKNNLYPSSSLLISFANAYCHIFDFFELNVARANKSTQPKPITTVG